MGQDIEVPAVASATRARDWSQAPGEASAGDTAGARRRAARKLALSALAVALLAALLPASAGAVTNGAIAGTFLDKNGGEPIDALSVCATPEPSGSGACAETNYKGEYIIDGLAPGEYKLETSGEECYFFFYCEALYHSYAQSKVKVESGKITVLSTVELEEAVGSISGTVTSGGAPIAGIEACAERLEAYYSSCAKTAANGAYAIEKLPAGKYAVEFRPKREYALYSHYAANYVPQYWQGQALRESAAQVTVNVGSATTGVNAAMQVGGKIAGKVTTASITPQPIANLRVCASSTALNKSGERVGEEECGLTNAAGEYTIQALGTAGYEVQFTGETCVEEKGAEKCSHPYIDQYYAGIVSVTAPNTASGVDGALLEVAATKPANAGAPSLSGAMSVGNVLSCTQGTWNDNPTSLAYKWLRNGGAIAGQTGSTYTVQSADRGTSISCEVTASNGAGSASATSNTVAIPKPSAGLAVLVSVHVKHGVASLTLRCTGESACAGTVKLAVKVSAGHGRHKHVRQVIVGSIGFSFAVGTHVTVKVHLNGEGRKLLAKARKKGLKVQITGSGVSVHASVLKEA
jgi:hypothetical protein